MLTTQENHENHKNKLIEIACKMIDENNGYTNVNMRTIAKKAGFAHTNIYNYFTNYVELLYAAMLKTMEKIVIFTQKQVGARASNIDHFSDFIEAQIEFSIQHQGLYRFFWLEELPGKVPSNIIEFARELKSRFAELIFNCSEGKLTNTEATEISEILHSYLHGEICKMISNRNLEVPLDRAREKIKLNVNMLMQLLCENKESLIY